jgi:hypothetical protein
MNNKILYLFTLCALTSAHRVIGAQRPTVLQGPKGKALPAQAAARRAKAIEKRAEQPEKGALSKRDIFSISMLTYNNKVRFIEESLPKAQNLLQRGNSLQAETIVGSLQAALVETQKLFAELLAQLVASDTKKIEKEFLPLIAPVKIESWKVEQRERLLKIADQIKHLAARMPKSVEPKQTPCQVAMSPVAVEPLGSGRLLKRQKIAKQDPQEQLAECQRCYADLLARFQQEETDRLTEKNRYEFDVRGFGQANDALAQQLDKIKSERDQLQQENAQLKQTPKEIPGQLLQDLAELRQQVEEAQERARMSEIYRGISDEQRAAYKKALDTIFAEIVSGYAVEEIENNPKKQEELVAKSKAEWSRTIANTAAEQFQKLLAQNLVSKEEIQEQIDKKIEDMLAEMNKPKQKLKAEPPKKK